MRISRVHTELWIVSAFLAVICSSWSAVAETGAAAPSAARLVHTYGSLIPLGAQLFSYLDAKKDDFYVLASARNAEFAGDAIWAEGAARILKTSAGRLVETYPNRLAFRISVGRRDGFLSVESPFPVESKDRTFNDFISNLQFQVRIYRALETRVLSPVSVRHIGVPLEVPSTERIYEVTFDLGSVPISDRVVVHVLTPEGGRLAKFSLDLY